MAVSHDPGLLFAVDFDGNGKDEFVVVDQGMTAHLYNALIGSSLLLPAGQVQLEGSRLLAMPVAVDRQLFVVHPGPDASSFRVSTWFVQPGGGFQLLATTTIRTVVGPLTSISATALDRDLDGDRSRDLLLAWSESRAGTARLLAMPFSLGTRPPPVALPRPAPAPGDVRVVAVQQVATPSGVPGEFRIAYSASEQNPWGGIGFGLLRSDGSAGGASWFAGLPSLLASGTGLDRDPVAGGAFSPVAMFDSAVVKTFFGPSILLGVDASEPYLSPRALLPTSASGRQLAACVADYDADDREEMVFVENLGPSGLPTLVIADPGPARHRVVTVPLAPWQTRPPFTVHHGATGDFDGDGDPDIALSVRWRNGMSGSGIVYLRNERRGLHFGLGFRRAQ